MTSCSSCGRRQLTITLADHATGKDPLLSILHPERHLHVQIIHQPPFGAKVAVHGIQVLAHLCRKLLEGLDLLNRQHSRLQVGHQPSLLFLQRGDRPL